jgi:hypothetical protein
MREKFRAAFIRWQHDNPTRGGIDGFMESMGLLQNDENGMPSQETIEALMKVMGIQK